jgi:hypothetical protein
MHQTSVVTPQQALRAERRRLVAERRRRERIETIKGIVGIALLLLALGIAGTMDYEDRIADLAGRPRAEVWQLLP